MLHLIANLQDRAFSVSNNKLFDKSSSLKPLLSWLTVENSWWALLARYSPDCCWKFEFDENRYFVVYFL